MAFTPQKNAFLFSGIIASIITILFFAIIASVLLHFFTEITPFITIPPAILLFAISLYFMNVRHKKTKLEFEKDQVLFFTGSPISDHQTTLNIKNITHLTLKKPFLEHLLFKTATIIIESAGSSGQEVHARSLPNADSVYEQLQFLMRNNGFSLKKQTLLQKEKPVLAAVVVKELGAAFVFFFFFGFAAIVSIIGLISQMPLLLIPVAIIIAAIAAGFFLRIQDLLRREYSIYDDVIEYQEGFLTKIDSIIPAENIADCNNTQTFIDRIFSTSNIIVSCQGSGDIAFRYMPRGEQLEQTIDKLAKAYTPLVGQAAGNRAQITTAPKAEKSIPKNTFTGSYGIDKFRSVFSSLGILLVAILVLLLSFVLTLFEGIFFMGFGVVPFLFILAVFQAATSLFQAFITTYEVRERGVYQSAEFISRKTQEFTDDKLVGISFTQSIIDRLFNTATITFLSLSSSPNISFRHIKNPEELISQLKTKYYLNTETITTKQAHFSLFAYLSKHALFIVPIVLLSLIPLFLFPRVTLIAYAVFTTLFIIAYVLAVLRHKNAHLVLGKEHLEHRVGFFITQTTLARYEDIKDQFAMHYRLSAVGELFINVGGVSSVQQDNQKALGAPNGFTARYLQNPESLIDEIDTHVLGRKPSQEIIQAAKSELKNSALAWLLFPPFLPIRLWQVSRFKYKATPDRIIKTRGVWNHQTQSITYSNIDHLSMKYGPTNKIFKNGSVLIYTIGSSAAEMVITNVKDAAAWQTLLEQRYQE